MALETVEAMRDALADDRNEEVVELVDRLNAAFGDLRAREEGYIGKARAVRSSGEADEAARQAALALHQQVGQATAARGRVHGAVGGYVSGELSGEEAASQVGDQVGTFEDLNAAAAELDETAPTDALPPTLVVTGPRTTAIPKGRSLDGDVVVGNVGGSAAGDVAVSVESSPTVDLSLSRTTIDVPADGEETVTLSGVPREDAEVTVEATTGDQVARTEFVVNVRDKREIVGEIVTDVFELLKRLRAALDRGGDGNGGGKGNSSGKGASSKSFEAKLEAVTKSVATAFDGIEDGDPPGAVDGKLRAAANQAQAFVNEVEAQRGKRLPEGAAAELAADGRSLVATIEEAREAER